MTTPAKKTTARKAAPATDGPDIGTDVQPAEAGAGPVDTGTSKSRTRKAPAKKAAPEFNPTVTDRGRLDHSTCGHPRTPAGRAECRANRAKDAKWRP